MNEEIDTDNSEPSSRTRWLGAGLIVLVLAVVVWQAWLAGEEAPARVAARVPLPALGDLLPSPEPRPAMPLPATAAAVPAGMAPTPLGSGLATDETEVCGLGRVKAQAGLPQDMAPITRAVRQARGQVLPLLLGGDETARAAGLLMQSLGGAEPADAMPPASATQARDELARMAVATRAPVVYAWAMRACQRQRGEGACQLLSADQWARLEPGNTIAWLNVAADAQARHDNAGVAEAMYRVSHAASSDARWGALIGVVLGRLPADTNVLGRAGLALEVAQIDTRAEIPLVAANQHCAVVEVRDANRQQVCAAVAEVLGARGSTLAESTLGATIGQRVGWPAERVSAAADERDAISQLSLLPQHPGMWSCPGLTKVLAQLTEVGQHGELVALRAALKRSPEGVTVLAKRYREAAAQRAAAAASAPASAAVATPS